MKILPKNGDTTSSREPTRRSQEKTNTAKILSSILKKKYFLSLVKTVNLVNLNILTSRSFRNEEFTHFL
jgi:hypothetical protein